MSVEEKVKEIIIDQLGVDEKQVSLEASFIDDLGAEKLSDTNRQNLYLIIDRRYREEKSLIITSNFTIDELNDYEPRIASRITEMGKIFFINGNDHRLI